MTAPQRSRPPVVGILAGIMVAGFAIFGSCRTAGAAEHWQAASTTAMSITGNVTFAPDKITFQNGASLPLSPIGRVSGFKGPGETVEATVYRVTVPADPVLKNGNHLCGSTSRTVPATFIAVWAPDPLPGDTAPRSMAVFPGKDPPRSVDPSSCGVFNFEAGD